MSSNQSVIRTQVQLISNDQQAINAAYQVADFALEDRNHRDQNRVLPTEQIIQFSQKGLGGIRVPQQYGGAFVSNKTLAHVFRILSKADANVGQILQNQFGLLNFINITGSDAQKQFIYAEILAGKRIVVVVAIIALLIWNKQRQNHSSELVIGISPSFAHPLQVAADEAKQQGLNVKLVEFSDWNTPNITLNHGDIDANFFQHQPFLNNAIKETGFKLKSFAAGAASHVGLYSKKYKSFDELPNGATVAIPNDPVNQGRALLLLQQAKLIELKDITANPKNLKFTEVEGPQTARAIDDVDLAFGYPHYLRLAKTADPESALLFDDNTNKRYAILFVVRDDYQDKDNKLQKFVEIYQNSPKVKAALDSDFGPTLWFPGWK